MTVRGYLQLVVQAALSKPDGETDGLLRLLAAFKQIGHQTSTEAIEGRTATEHVERGSERLQILLSLLLVPVIDGLVDERQADLALLVHQTETLPLHTFLLFLGPRLEQRHTGTHHIRQLSARSQSLGRR